MNIPPTFHTPFDEVCEQGLEYICTVLHPALQGNHDQAGHVHSVSHGEVSKHIHWMNARMDE